MATPKAFDYIIAGAGCAGLSLAIHMIHSGQFQDKKILLVDQDPKRSNDRTWCFWETRAGLFEDIVYRQWDHIRFYGEAFNRDLQLTPYRYKMIRGVDFYEHCLGIIKKQKNVSFYQGKITHVFSDRKATGIIIDGKAILADYVFNSIIFRPPVLKGRQRWLLQHFKGWVVRTKEPVFSADKATLMDFRISQQHGTAFCYVLPASSTEALVEYTLFTDRLLEPAAYDEGLKLYIKEQLGIEAYEIAEEEFGVIPMTNFRFPAKQHNLVHIGTAGGQTKGSSGYTFRFIQKHSKAIVDQLIQTGRPFTRKPARRFHFYDSVLLEILHTGAVPGKTVFTELFKRNPAPLVFKFLDNETTLPEELKIISSLPTLPFARAAMHQLR